MFSNYLVSPCFTFKEFQLQHLYVLTLLKTKREETREGDKP